MTDEQRRVTVRFMPEFERNIRDMAKTYRRIRSDIQTVTDQLEAGERPGDQVSGVPYVIYKVRVRNSDIGKGKSAGYRLIYLVRSPVSVALVAVYSKSDQSDISPEQIRWAVSEDEGSPSEEGLPPRAQETDLPPPGAPEASAS